MKKRKAKVKPDKFELWLKSWMARVAREVYQVPPEDRTISDPFYAGLVAEYKILSFSLIKYHKFKMGKK